MNESAAKTEYKPTLAQLNDQEGEALCAQLRRELVEDVSKTGGHLASNLGVVELTIAMHLVCQLPGIRYCGGPAGLRCGPPVLPT